MATNLPGSSSNLSTLYAKTGKLLQGKAGLVYELLGKESMRTMLFPPQQTLIGGDIAFRQHEAGHTTGPNWPCFIEFTKRYFLK